MSVRYRQAFDAVQTVEREASPQLAVAARAVALAIPAHVPVHRGVVKRSYSVEVETESAALGGHPRAQVVVASPFWHWMEYGTRFNPPYRPIQSAVRAVGLEYRPQ